MNSEQGKAWQERAEAAERENERLHAVVQDLRDSLMSIRDETSFMDDPSMSITAMRNGATELRALRARVAAALYKAAIAADWRQVDALRWECDPKMGGAP